MKIAVIGGGVSGVTFAINRKRKHPEDEIFLFEHTDKLLKKVLATGNGKCNIANSGDTSLIYNHSFARNIIDVYDYKLQNQFLDSVNIKTKLVGNLSYPISESAATVRNALLKALEESKAKVLTETNVLDYYVKGNNYIIKTDKGDFEADKIVIATGGKSLPKSGSDGSILSILDKHGYKIVNMNPALCPIYTKEKTKLLDGTRVKANVQLFEKNNLLFKEDGEVLFKERGLSGIVIFNLSRIIAKDLNKEYKIKIDLLPDINEKELNKFLDSHDKKTLLESYLHPNLAKYLLEMNGDVIKNTKEMTFTFDKLYGFENSQITVGGISLEEIDSCLASNREKNVYFIGEVLDIDAPCGGYNLMWAIGSAIFLSDRI